MDYADGAYVGDMNADLQLLVNYLGGTMGNVPLLTEPRMIAVVSASYIERYVTELIEAHMPRMTSEIRDRLFGADKALGTITAKNDLARALGATDEGLWHNVRLIMQIRNQFAHDLRVMDFDDSAVRKQVDRLRWEQNYIGVAQATIDKIEAVMAARSRGQRFRDIALQTALSLSNACTENRKKKVAASGAAAKPQPPEATAAAPK